MPIKPSKYQIMITILLAGVILLSGNLFFFLNKQKVHRDSVSWVSMLKYINAVASSYKDETGKDIYSEANNIKDLIDALSCYESSSSMSVLKRQLEAREGILYLIKSKESNTPAFKQPVIICQLPNGRCIAMTRGKQIYTTWDPDNSNCFLPETIWYKSCNANRIRETDTNERK